MWTMAAEASGVDPNGVAAIIGAIGALLVAVFGALYKFTSASDGRADRATVESMKSLVAARDSAQAGEAKARANEAAAYKERDRWQDLFRAEQDENTELRVRVATLEAEARRRGRGA